VFTFCVCSRIQAILSCDSISRSVEGLTLSLQFFHFFPLRFSYYCLQAIKIFDFLQYCFSFTDSTAYYGRKWLLVDLTYCVVLSQLRIPRLNYSKAVILLQILSFWFFDGLLFGGIRLNVFGGSSEGTVSTSGFRSAHRPFIDSLLRC
jgi:hypothetical protein